MKYLYTFIFLLFTAIGYGQTIHLAGYTNGDWNAICPNARTTMTFFARDAFQNKLVGEFKFRFYVDNLLYDSLILSEPEFEPDDVNGDLIHEDTINILPQYYEFWVQDDPFNLGTDSNNEISFDVLHRRLPDAVRPNGDTLKYYNQGFGVQTDNIRVEVKFRKTNFPVLPWVTKNFYIKTRAKSPEKAVVQGTDELVFCAPNEIKILRFDNIPNDANNANFCYWHHAWVWELPQGWKVTSENGNLSSANNEHEGGNIVKVQAPAVLPSGNVSLIVRSEDGWDYPVSTQTPILIGTPDPISALSYNFSLDFPETICYDSQSGYGDFFAEINQTSLNSGSSFQWQSNAGTVVYPNTTNPTTTIQFNNPGTNRYVRVRAVNACGVSTWYTKYFDLDYEPFGCSGGGGIGGLSMIVSPNPVQSDLNVELVSTNSDNQLESKTLEKDLHLVLVNAQKEKVYERISRKRANEIPTRNLSAGRYIIIAYYRGKKYSKHIVVKN